MVSPFGGKTFLEEHPHGMEWKNSLNLACFNFLGQEVQEENTLSSPLPTGPLHLMVQNVSWPSLLFQLYPEIFPDPLDEIGRGDHEGDFSNLSRIVVFL